MRVTDRARPTPRSAVAAASTAHPASISVRSPRHRCRSSGCHSGRAGHGGHHGRFGFTLIELMVVITIIVMAAGMMIPSLTDFFRNRELEGVVSQMTASFNSARLQSVANNRPFAVVFFREGVRIYDIDRQTWMAGEEFNPDDSAAASDKIDIDLVFAGMHSDCNTPIEERECLPRYDDWYAVVSRHAAARAERDHGSADDGVLRFSIDHLIAIIFERDGTMRPVVPSEVYVYAAGADGDDGDDYGGRYEGGEDGDGGGSRREEPAIAKRVRQVKGSDVPAAAFKKNPPENADIVVYQRGSDQAGFIDLQMTGAMKSKVASASIVLERRLSAREDRDDDGDGGY